MDQPGHGDGRAKRSQVAGPVGGQADGQAVVEQVLCASGADAVAGEQTGIAHQTFCMDFLAQARAAQGVFPDERLPVIKLNEILSRVEPSIDKLTKERSGHGVVFEDDGAGKALVDDCPVALHVAERTAELGIAHAASQAMGSAFSIDHPCPIRPQSTRAIDAEGNSVVKIHRVQCRNKRGTPFRGLLQADDEDRPWRCLSVLSKRVARGVL